MSYPGDGSLARVLPIHGVLLEEEEDLVVLGVVALRDQVYAQEPGVCRETQQQVAATLSRFVLFPRLSSLFCNLLSRNRFSFRASVPDTAPPAGLAEEHAIEIQEIIVIWLHAKPAEGAPGGSHIIASVSSKVNLILKHIKAAKCSFNPTESPTPPHSFFSSFLTAMLCFDGNPFTPILHLRNQNLHLSPIFCSHGSAATAPSLLRAAATVSDFSAPSPNPP